MLNCMGPAQQPQVWAAWMYRPRYPDGISASAKALALATAGTERALGLERGAARVWWITRLTAVPTLARGKPGEARSVSRASTSSAAIAPVNLSFALGVTAPSSHCRHA